MGRRRRHGVVPIDIAAGDHFGASGIALNDQAEIRLVARDIDRRIEQRFVLYDSARFDAARPREDRLGAAIIDAHGQFIGSKTAEHHRMHRAQSRAGQHGDHSFGNHRHVDHHPVALGDTARRQRTGAQRHAVGQFGIAIGLLGAGDRAVIDQCGACAMSRGDMPVERIMAGIEFGPGEPAVKRRARIIQHPVPLAGPLDALGRLGPE